MFFEKYIYYIPSIHACIQTYIHTYIHIYIYIKAALRCLSRPDATALR